MARCKNPSRFGAYPFLFSSRKFAYSFVRIGWRIPKIDVMKLVAVILHSMLAFARLRKLIAACLDFF